MLGVKGNKEERDIAVEPQKMKTTTAAKTR